MLWLPVLNPREALGSARKAKAHNSIQNNEKEEEALKGQDPSGRRAHFGCCVCNHTAKQNTQVQVAA